MPTTTHPGLCLARTDLYKLEEGPVVEKLLLGCEMDFGGLQLLQNPLAPQPPRPHALVSVINAGTEEVLTAERQDDGTVTR